MRYPFILHHGALIGVAGFCHQLQIDVHHVLLVDCGSFQGAETSPEGQAMPNRLDIDFSLAGTKALVAIHVHIDHVGHSPYLLAAGFTGAILCRVPSLKHLIIKSNHRDLPCGDDGNHLKPIVPVLERTLADHGVVLILSFDIGHAQEPEGFLHRKAARNQPTAPRETGGDARYNVLFVGYQAESTITCEEQGKRCRPIGRFVEMDGQRYAIRAQVHTIGSYSAHAAQKKGTARFATPSQACIMHRDGAIRTTLVQRSFARYCPVARDLTIEFPEGSAHAA
ncbi:hypothetical protein [Ectopseudomonas hydrolytica]|uniref:hypothetical protein n=1 Tax=Ectopseudomonas hydrolytica TaxID=2493633 RepID=UPI00376EEEAC